MPVAQATPNERLQPCLFDRLMDEDILNKQESRVARVISLSEYRAAVLRDLGWLLNSNCHIQSEGLADFPHVESSVFNFGTPSLSGLGIAGMDVQELEAAMALAVRNFEPRIVPDTLVVRAVRESVKGSPSTLVFEIRGELWARPFPEKLFIKTTLDLETGEVKL
ncbi:MAG: type VI secretion system baseplate subunit TssE [Chthoniobacteraceae bacterium]